MLHRTQTNLSLEGRPLSRQELINSLCLAASKSLEDLHEPFYVNIKSKFDDLKAKLESKQISIDEFEDEFHGLPEEAKGQMKAEFEALLKAKRSVPKSPLSIVNPFPLVEPQNSRVISKLFTETQDELMELQIKFRKGLLGLAEIQSRFQSWTNR